MKKLFLIFVLLVLSSVLFAQKAGDIITFSSVDLNGNTVTDKLFTENKITMVNIWGTFCPPCIREMPDLGKLSIDNKAKAVEIVGIPIDIIDGNGNLLTQENRDARLIIKKTGADYVHIVPTVDMLYGFLRNVQAVPTTIFVDSSGKQIGEVYLGARSRRDWQKIIDDLLAAQK